VHIYQRKADARGSISRGKQMRQARDVAKIYGAERIAVMSALNIIHEFLQRRREQDKEQKKTAELVRSLVERIDSTLAE